MQENEDKRNTSPVERRTETTGKTVCTFSSLVRSERRCHRRVGYKNSVSRFHLLTMSKCYGICKDISNGSYKTGVGKSFEVYEPKYRIVTSTSYNDRIPQTSFVLDIFYPRVVPNMVAENFACYKDKGVDAARDKMIENLKLANMDDYVLCADIKNYFGSIDHQKLIEELVPFIGHEDIWFYEDVIESNKQNIGLTLGSEINQLSASSFLYRFDKIAVSMGLYERYMDDIRFIGSKERCLKVLEILENFARSVNLELSVKKTYIQPISRPVSFLGFTFLKHPSGKVTMKRKKDKVNHEKRKLRRMKKANVPFERVQVHCQSVRAGLKKGNRSGVVKYDNFVKSLFAEEMQNENHESKQSGRSQYEESIFPLVTCGRKNRGRNQNGVSHPGEIFDLSGTDASQKETYECPPG